MNPASQRLAGVAFGRFQVVPDRRELLADGQPVKLGGRAFDVLVALIEAHGALVSKDALMARVWPGRIIEENNLASQIAALRAALGRDRDLIRTVSGRGYQLIGEIRVLSDGGDKGAGLGLEATGPAALPPTNLPDPVSELIGRDDELAEVVNLITAHRLVTLTGAGGIGKTRLAVALARESRPHFADGVWLAQFSPLADPNLVPAAVASAVGLELGGEASVQSVAQGLAGRRLLLVLDTCEHVIEIAASMAEAALGAGSELRILATSRESLKAEGEWVYSVPPLLLPTTDSERQDLFEYGAIRLFLERARAADPHFALNPPPAELIAAICRRLDGIPLAIELAAARAAALGIDELTARLDERFNLLTGGRRTALPRHQTLRATLDWSYELLPEPECILLRRLAIFAGPFRLGAASAIAVSSELSASTAVDGITSLIAKSLIQTEGGAHPRYRLLDTTRAYALEKLVDSGELQAVAYRHADYYRDLFERSEAEEKTLPMTEWSARYGWQINDLRAALDWAFSPSGDASIGVALTAAAVPLWAQLSLLKECRDRVERALATLGPGRNWEPRCEMKLHSALAASLIYTRGAAVPETGAVWSKSLEIAESLDDAEYRLRAFWGLWIFHIISGRHPVALELAQRFSALAGERPDPHDRLVGERLIGVAQLYLGDLESAQRRLNRVLADYVAPDQMSHILRYQSDERVITQAFLAWVLWLRGCPDQAMRTAESSVADARAANHSNSLCYALALAACPIALVVGDLTAAEYYVGMLLDHSTRHALATWRANGHCFQGGLIIKRGDVAAGLRLLRAGLDELGEARSPVLRLIAYQTAETLGRAGQIADGLAAVEEAIARSEQTQERWSIADLLRVKGELILLRRAPGTAAEDQFRQALDLSRKQGALSWELRAATSLAQMLRDQGRSADALALLQPIYDRFTEGFDTADLKEAKLLIDAL